MPDSIVFKLPTDGAGLGGIDIHSSSCNLTIRYEYRENRRDLIGEISFGLVCLYRFTGEMFCPTFSDCSYDTLCIVGESAWLPEVKLTAASDWILEARHYALYLSNNGYLEVIACSAVQGQISEGLLADVSKCQVPEASPPI